MVVVRAALRVGPGRRAAADATGRYRAVMLSANAGAVAAAGAVVAAEVASESGSAAPSARLEELKQQLSAHEDEEARIKHVVQAISGAFGQATALSSATGRTAVSATSSTHTVPTVKTCMKTEHTKSLLLMGFTPMMPVRYERERL